jgi:positive regulator of sigma E activity
MKDGLQSAIFWSLCALYVLAVLAFFALMVIFRPWWVPVTTLALSAAGVALVRRLRRKLK